MESTPGAIPSPNIWHHPEVYEIENRAFDRGGVVFEAVEEVAGLPGRTVLDLGCGTGFHLPRLGRDAARAIGVEPHPDLAALARRRVRRLPRVEVLAGTAQALPLEDASVDVVHARWAYFFGPGCEPGLAELDRVVRRGGTAFVIDNDASTSTFGAWFREGYPHLEDQDVIEAFWAEQGWQTRRLLLAWDFGSRGDLERVVRIELPAAAADTVLAGHEGSSVDYAVVLRWRHY